MRAEVGYVALATQHTGRREGVGDVALATQHTGRLLPKGKGYVSENSRHNFLPSHRAFPSSARLLILHSTLNRPILHVVLLFPPCYLPPSSSSFFTIFFVLFDDIGVRKGKYKPESEEGRKLLAHELTHVAQNQNKEFVDHRTREELEEEAEANERTAESIQDPLVTRVIDGKEYTLPVSRWHNVSEDTRNNPGWAMRCVRPHRGSDHMCRRKGCRLFPP